MEIYAGYANVYEYMCTEGMKGIINCYCGPTSISSKLTLGLLRNLFELKIL